jgi:hypothetical protein
MLDPDKNHNKIEPSPEAGQAPSRISKLNPLGLHLISSISSKRLKIMRRKDK